MKENLVETGENTGYQHIPLFPQSFPKTFLRAGIKLWIVWFNVNRFPNKPWFLHVNITTLLKTQWEKEKLLIKSNFSFSHIVFYPFVELSAIFIKFEIVTCKLSQFEPVQNIVIWEMVNSTR